MTAQRVQGGHLRVVADLDTARVCGLGVLGDPARLDEEQRWDFLRRSLTDETILLDTCAGAALVLLFGLPVSRIGHLTIDQLDISEARSLRETGQHPLLPPKLAGLLKQLADAPHTRPRLAKGGNAPRWLFPGLTPGRPTSQPGFRVKFRALGIDARPARNAALISLAGNLPIPVLADVLGLSTTTAERWAALAKRDSCPPTSPSEPPAPRLRPAGKNRARWE